MNRKNFSQNIIIINQNLCDLFIIFPFSLKTLYLRNFSFGNSRWFFQSRIYHVKTFQCILFLRLICVCFMQKAFIFITSSAVRIWIVEYNKLFWYREYLCYLWLRNTFWQDQQLSDFWTCASFFFECFDKLETEVTLMLFTTLRNCTSLQS